MRQKYVYVFSCLSMVESNWVLVSNFDFENGLDWPGVGFIKDYNKSQTNCKLIVDVLYLANARVALFARVGPMPVVEAEEALALDGVCEEVAQIWRAKVERNVADQCVNEWSWIGGGGARWRRSTRGRLIARHFRIS